MLTISFRNLWEHKLRSFLLGGAIVTGVAFVVASLVFTDSLKAGFTDLFSEALSSIDVQVNPRVDEDDPLASFMSGLPTMDASLAGVIADVDGVAEVIPQVQAFMNLEPFEGETTGFGPPNIGFGWVDNQDFFRIEDGHPPRADGEVALSAVILETRGLDLGDTIRLAGTGALEEFEIVGVIGFGASEGATMGPRFGAFTFDKARQLFEMEDLVSAFGINLTEGADIAQVVEELNHVLPEEVEAVDAQSAAEAQAAEFQEGISFFNTFLLVFAGISLVVGAFVVYNAFRVVVAQRTRELGLLRVLGTTRAELLRMVILEAVIIGLVASAVGVVVGVGVAIGVRALLETFGNGSLPGGGLTITWQTVLTGILVGTVTATVSALLPAVRATRISPMAALRDQVEVRHARPWWVWAGIGVTGTSTTAILLAVGQARGTAGAIAGNADPVTLAGFAALGLFLGFFLLARVFARPVIGLLGRGVRSLTAQLARENARRTPRRTATTAASLMIGLGLVATVAILSASVEDTIIQAVEDSFSADILVSPGGFNPLGGIPDEVYPRVVETPGVGSTARLNIIPAVLPDGNPNFVVGIDPETVDLAINFEDVEGTWDEVTDDGLAVQRVVADKDGLELGDTVGLEFTTGTEEFRVVAIFDLQGGVSDSQSYYINYERIRQIDPAVPDYSVLVRVAPDAEIPAVIDSLNEMLSDYGGVTASGVDSLIAQVSGPLEALTGMVAGLLLMSVLVAVVGIVLTLYLAVHERTREIGLLRAIGMTRPQVTRTIRWESVFIAVYGAVLGLVIGIFLGWSLTVTVIGEGAALAIPWTWVVAGFFGSAVAGVLAAIIPARQATKLDILTAIAYE